MSSFTFASAKPFALAVACLIAPLATLAQAPVDEYVYEADREKWFVRGGARVLFNVKASVSAQPEVTEPGRYDNGFVFSDAGSSGSGTTWNWGYEDSSQIVGSEVLYNRLNGVPVGGLMDGESSLALGGEVLFGAQLAEFEFRGRPARFGWELGYAFNSFSVDSSSEATGTATLTGESYTLGALPAPTAPYTGSAAGPGPVISSTPSSSGTLTSPVTSTFDGELESSLHQMKVGAWLEYPLGRRMTAHVSAGYSAMFADSRLRYTDSYTFDNPAFTTVDATERQVGGRDWQPGIYTQFRARYDFNQHVGAYLGGELQYNKDLEFGGNGRDIKLEFGPSFGVTAGVEIQF